MSLDRLQSKPGLFSIGPEATPTNSFPGGLSLGTNLIIAEGLAAQTGGALAPVPTPRSGTVPTIANSGTFTHNNCGTMVVTTGGAVTGTIVQLGTYHGQMLTLINNSANTITMAAAGTSNVAAGVAAIVPATAALSLVYNALDSKWYDVG